MIRAVLDTNVLISAVLAPVGPAGLLVEAARSQLFELWLSDENLTELREKLDTKKIENRLKPGVKEVFFAAVTATRYRVEQPVFEDIVKSDPDDNHIVAAARGCRAGYIVTGDKKHLLPLDPIPIAIAGDPNEGAIRVVSPRDFLDFLNQTVT